MANIIPIRFLPGIVQERAADLHLGPVRVDVLQMGQPGLRPRLNGCGSVEADHGERQGSLLCARVGLDLIVTRGCCD